MKTDMNWTKNLSHSLFVLDGLLGIFFVLAVIPQTTGIMLHEWIGVLIALPFAVHLIVHWQWIVSLPRRIRGNASLKDKLNTTWNFALYVVMLLAILSGILISEALLPLFGFELVHDRFWSMIHHNFSEALLPMIGIHLALHWDWILRVGGSVLGKSKVRAR